MNNFRAFRKDLDCHGKPFGYVPTSDIGILANGALVFRNGWSNEFVEDKNIENNYIVEKSTNAKDKNGVEMFENDIVEDEEKNLYRIMFRDGTTSFDLFNKKSKKFDCPVGFYKRIIRVVGNIHEEETK